MDLIKHLRNNPFFLAPMAGITDCAFRSFMRELGCGIMTTELVSATGFQFNSPKTKTLMKFTEDQHPIGVQIFGENLDHLALLAQHVEEKGADFVDLNFGCPVNKVVKKGAGAGVLKDLRRLTQILKVVKKAIHIPLTIKVRTGWNEERKNAHTVSHIAYNEGISWMTIHGRTRTQAYLGLSDWDYIQNVKETSKLPIIGNGDLTSAQKALKYLKQSNCDAVMIGRGALKNPLIFHQTLSLYKNKAWDLPYTISSLIDKLAFHLEKHYDEKRVGLQIKKFASWYSSGYPESASFRKKAFQIKTLQEIKNYTKDFFSSFPIACQKDTSHENFLRGGHG